MPRISDSFTDCSVFIYGSIEDARNGERHGGSGFIAGVRSKVSPELHYAYVVTNWHVVRKANTPVVRFNRKNGTTECLETNLSQWTGHRFGDDVAVMPFGLEPQHDVRMLSIAIEMFVTKELIAFEDIGIGDDVFMVGRFISHEGRQQNAPATRFGNIAMMPIEPIKSETGIDQESFLVEVRSLPGYSGSPVFIYSAAPMNDMSLRRFGSDIKYERPPEPSGTFKLLDPELFDRAMKQMKAKGPYLLGIDWCHLRNKSLVRDPSGDPIGDKSYVYENTGMAGVIPAWKIAEILDSDDLMKSREEADKTLSRAT